MRLRSTRILKRCKRIWTIGWTTTIMSEHIKVRCAVPDANGDIVGRQNNLAGKVCELNLT